VWLAIKRSIASDSVVYIFNGMHILDDVSAVLLLQ
jgi:hypothetical protein